MSRSPVRRIVACMGGFLIAVGFACGYAAEEKKAPTDKADLIRVDPSITLTVSQDDKGIFTLQAVPYVALRQHGTDIKWSIVSPDRAKGYSVEIEFGLASGFKGPFPKRDNDPGNPVRGRYLKAVTGSDAVDTLPSDRPANTSWQYSVILRDAKNNDVATLDPIVIFK